MDSNKLLAALKDLKGWHDHMGGWDGPAWPRAFKAIREAEAEAKAASILPAPVYVVGVEGGIVQGMSTNRPDLTPPSIIVCDWDVQDDDGLQIDPDDYDNRAGVEELWAVADVPFINNVLAALDRAEQIAEDAEAE